MVTPLDKLLDQGLTDLRQNTIDTKQLPSELQELILLAQNLQRLPHKAIPSPIKRRKYLLEATGRKLWHAHLPTLRLLWFGAASLIVLLIAVSAYGTAQSVPGEKLFTYKRTTEQLRLKFARTSKTRANLQLDLAEKRLAEARFVLATRPENTALATAVLTELANQTKTTAATVEDAAKDTASQNPELVQKLADVASSQMELLQSIASEDQNQTVAREVLPSAEETSRKVADLKELVAANFYSNLTTPPTKETFKGSIAVIRNGTSLTIGDTTIMITTDTIVTDIEQRNLSPDTLTAKTVVEVAAKKEQDQWVAEIITLVSAIKTAAPKKPNPTPAEESAEDTGQPLEDTKVRAGFIPEDPAQQFVP